MTREEFIGILDREQVPYYFTDAGVLYVENSGVLYSHSVYIHPAHYAMPGMGCFSTTANISDTLDELSEEDVMDFVKYYWECKPAMDAKKAEHPKRIVVDTAEYEQLKAENARMKEVLERHGIKLLK